MQKFTTNPTNKFSVKEKPVNINNSGNNAANNEKPGFFEKIIETVEGVIDPK